MQQQNLIIDRVNEFQWFVNGFPFFNQNLKMQDLTLDIGRCGVSANETTRCQWDIRS